MTVNLYSATGHSAGEESSSTYEGRHVTFEESAITHPYHADGFVDAGEPVNVGDIVGVAFNSAAVATDLIAVDTEGIWYLSVVASDDNGVSAVAVGDQLYINTGVVSKRASGIPYGKALSALSGSASAAVAAVKVHCELRDVDSSYIVVSKAGNDTTGNGSWGAPYLTIAKAITVWAATRPTIFVLPGEYDEAAIVWPNVTGLYLIGLGAVSIVNSAAAAAVITISPTYTASTLEATIKDINIAADTQIAISIGNANMSKKLNVYLDGVTTEMDTSGDSIDVTGATTTQAIRLYIDNCNFEGLVHFTATNAGSRLRCATSKFVGGITTAGAVACELSLRACEVLTSGLTIGDATWNLTYRGSLYATDADPAVYTELADAYSS
jgi:predicted RecA/RadA family phage recombinase